VHLDLCLPWTVQLADAETTGRKFGGIAAVVGSTDDDRDYSIAPGAFDDAVRATRKGRWPMMLVQHGQGSMFGGSIDDQMPVGIWTRLAVTGEGDEQRLEVEGELAETARGQELAALLRMKPRPALDGLSIGFVPTKIRENAKPKDGEKRRVFQSLDIHEISLVTFPAMGRARVRSVQAAASERQLKRFLVRDAGWTDEEAAALMARGWPGVRALRDAGTQEAQGIAAADLAALQALAAAIAPRNH
jgi:uncharacterized protein